MEGRKMAIITKNESIQIDRLILGPYGTNCYILTCLETGESLLVDAPAEASEILETARGSHPRYLFITHNHGDHTGALSELKSKLNIPVAAHRLDAGRLPLKPEILLEDGQEISLGKMRLKVLHTPGHTPGSVGLLAGKSLIAGDTLFPGGPGHTRTPADLKRIIESITQKILVLPGDTEVHPGHGDSTIVKKAKEEVAVFLSRPHDPLLCGDVLWLSS
jgi:hydroxyacylglutathione hydrolase